jgi:ubiquinone/menaquinone biosynthesis C-methylase UbiE
MIILKEILLNQLIRTSVGRKLARRVNAKTGMNGNEDYVKKTYSEYTKYCEVAGKSILELGPGHTYQTALMALQHGATSVDIADIELVIDLEVLKQNNIKFTLYDGSQLPYKDNSFDCIWSHTVYEHLRFPETTVAETFRLLKPGGTAVHWIDMRDHFVLDNNNPKVFNMLQYKPSIWKAMTWNRSTYVNCLRFSEWITLHKKYGFEVVKTEKEISNVVAEYHREGKIDYLKKYTAEDASCAQMLIVVKKPQ